MIGHLDFVARGKSEWLNADRGHRVSPLKGPGVQELGSPAKPFDLTPTGPRNLVTAKQKGGTQTNRVNPGSGTRTLCWNLKVPRLDPRPLPPRPHTNETPTREKRASPTSHHTSYPFQRVRTEPFLRTPQ